MQEREPCCDTGAVRSKYSVFWRDIFSGYGLKCYKCQSEMSWDECTGHKTEETCASAQDTCGKAHVEAKKENLSMALYTVGCTTSEECKTIADGNCTLIVGNDSSIEFTKCDVSCCDVDLCNGAKVIMISAITLMTCAFVTLFVDFKTVICVVQ